MTNQEAIKIIEDKVRWLPTCSDIVREALDVAISALQAQELSKNSPKLDKGNGDLQPTCNQLAKDTNVPCKDVISRQAVFEALEKVVEFYPYKVPGDSDTYSSYNEAWNDAIGRAEMEIESLPSAQPTLYGYKIEHLAYIAMVMQKEGITADKAVEIFSDIACVVTMLIEEIQNMVDKEMERCAT